MKMDLFVSSFFIISLNLKFENSSAYIIGMEPELVVFDIAVEE